MIDVSEVRALAADLNVTTDEVLAAVTPVVARGALNIKRQMQAEASRSRHFKLAHTISYETTRHVGDVSAEIGPVRGGAGSLAGIAYFGGARGGGGTVPDPQGALDAEAPRFEDALAAALEAAW